MIYKPHPLTGYRNPAARRAHQRIHALLEGRELSRSMARHPAGTARRGQASRRIGPAAAGDPPARPARGGSGTRPSTARSRPSTTASIRPTC
ncbi:hypothetical protein ACFQX6_33155 [Streptosporangium lutulentum]